MSSESTIAPVPSPPSPSSPLPPPLPPVETLDENIAAWVELVDQMEAAHATPAAHNPTAARSVTPLVDAVEAGLHALQPAERVAARTYLWRRDHADEPLPAEADQAWWSLCPCRTCRLDQRRAAFDRIATGMPDAARRRLLRVAAPHLGPSVAAALSPSASHADPPQSDR